MTPFIKLKRSAATLELLKHPNSFNLLALIAYRAKRTGDFSVHDLEIGEALIGDFKSCGLTRQQHRTALSNLKKWQLVTTRATNRGTIAKIVNSNIFDINPDESNHQNNQTTTNEQPASNQPATTNKNDKKRKNDNYSDKSEQKNPTRKKQKISFPNGFSLTDNLIEYARKQGVNGNLASVFEDFRDYHMKHGSAFVDWNAAFRTWIRKHVEFEKQKPGGAVFREVPDMEEIFND